MPTDLALMEVFSDRDSTPKYIIVHSDGRLLSRAEAETVIAIVNNSGGQLRISAPPIVNT